MMKIREQAAASGAVQVYIPVELDDEQRAMMAAVIREHAEKLSGEMYGEWDNGPGYAEGLEEYMQFEAPIDELYGKFLQCFHELSEGPPMPRPSPVRRVK